MDILNWLHIKKQQLIRTTLDSPKDLVILGADVSFQKRGDKYQSYAMPAEDFLAPVARPYKVYTALLTQTGTDDPLDQTSGTFTVGVSYRIGGYVAGDDFSNIGGPGVGVDGQWDGQWFVATGTTPLNYTNGTLIQWNTGAPVVTVLENTIGNVWFTYDTDGLYYANSSGLFITDKITPFIGTQGVNILSSTCANTNLVEILTYSVSIGNSANDILYNTPIEIRVYN
jgi:hypothetical protein